MIQCIINGHKAYPLSTSSIKVTYANQYVTDDGQYTYDITFPMNILANREIFNNVSRFEVNKKLAKYDDCKLYCNGMLIMSGVGTVLSITQNEVKLQILGGKSRVKYNSRFNKHYIDEIDLGKASAPGKTFAAATSLSDILLGTKSMTGYILSADKKAFLGEKGKYTFVPVNDESSENLVANFIGVDMTGKLAGSPVPYIQNVAVQPNLNYILSKVLEVEGYKVVQNDFDCEPWSRLYIASAFKTLELNKALPHWSSYTFLEEYRKLFNASISFDENTKTVRIVKASELTANEEIAFEPIDEYSVDYDEDGSLNTLDTKNIEYNLGNSTNRDDYEVIPKKVMDSFEIVEFDELAQNERLSVNSRAASWDGPSLTPDIDNYTQSWSEKKKKTTIIHKNDCYYVYFVTDERNEGWKMCGFWSPLIRYEDSDDYIDLNISPAVIIYKVFDNLKDAFGLTNCRRSLLSVPNDKEAEFKDMATDENGFAYVTVQDAIEDESSLDESEDDQECMNVFFLGDELQPVDYWFGGNNIPAGFALTRWPTIFTDYHKDNGYDGDIKASLRLNSIEANSIGVLHNAAVIDNHNSIEIKFRSRGIPDPSHIFVFRNKRYICEKIEIEVRDDMIEPVKTGYFYMMS